MLRRNTLAIRWTLANIVIVMVGCTTRPPFFPNADSDLRKSSKDFAADAANRHYEASAPRGGDADGRAEVDYGYDRIYLADTSPTDWNNCELWINKMYVIFLPKVAGNGARALTINFASLFDASGEHFPFKSTPLTGTQTPVDTIEIYRGGKMYNVTMALAD